MSSHTAKSLMKDFRASFRRKKAVDPSTKINALKEAEDEELAKLVELKETLGDQLPPSYSDIDLLSFLRARSLNVKEAAKLVKLDDSAKRFLQMKDFQPSEEFMKYNFCGVIGFDKEGSLVRIINMGVCDTKGFVNAVSTVTTFQSGIWMINNDLALMEAENKKTGRRSFGFSYILNLEDITLNQLTYKPAFDTGVLFLKLLQDHYHDVLKTIFIINAPPFFSSVYKLVKPAIQEALHKRIKILDGNWKEDLLNLIDADILPKSIGGNRVDSKGDPKCYELLGSGGTIPQSLYATNFLDIDNPDVVVATVPAGATLNFRYPVRQIGSILKYHIQAKDNDIGLAVFWEPFQSGVETPRTRKKKEEDMSRFEQLTPIIRCQCHICPAEGSTVLWFTGTVILHFDNTYSWMNSKEVYFKVSVRPPTVSSKNYLNSAAAAVEKLKISS